MTTLFDIGDKIELTMTGIVKEFSVSKSGDCYTIVIQNKDKELTRVYLDGKALLASNAKKVD